MDFINLKQYSLTKWYQLFWMVVNRSLVDGTFSWIIFQKNFHHKFSIWFSSKLLLTMLLIFYAFPEKRLSSPLLCDKMHYDSEKWLHHQSNFLSMEWKNYLGINVHTCIDCWGNDCHFPCFIKWYATSYYELFGKFTCFLQPVIFICFIWMLLDKMFQY